jgi:DMSO/TMAO reductase YedYZ molybdopterin-dependent catalytic subunit
MKKTDMTAEIQETDAAAELQKTPKVRMKKSNIAILAAVVILVVLVAIISIINRQASEGVGKSGFLLIRAGGADVKEYSVSEIQNLPSVDLEKTITSSKSADESGVYTGVPLEAILDDAAPGWEDHYKEFLLKADDGFVSSVFASDVLKGENVLIVYAKDGEMLKAKEDGGIGPLRAVIAEDPFGNRSTYYLTVIELME